MTPPKAKKVREIREILARGQRRAVRRVIAAASGTSSEADTRWEDRTFGQMAAMELARGVMAIEKAKAVAASGTGTVNLGVVVSVPVIEDAKTWEQMGKLLEARKDVIDIPAIDAAKEPEEA